MIAELSIEFPVQDLCEMLEVARSGYYQWLEERGQESKREAMDREWGQIIRAIYDEKRGLYGSPRITAELRRRGERCNHKRVERLMRQEGLQGRRSRKKRPRTTQSDHGLPVAPNLLRGRAAPANVDEVWVADITYVPTAEGWLFVAAVMDLYSRQIIGWSVWETLAAIGAVQALNRALVKRDYPRGVMHHSDRGAQYASWEYRQVLRRHGLVASMSRKGNCYDNAVMEAFWSTLKREALDGSAGWTKDRVRRVIFEYIEGNYNRTRLHSSLGYQSPVDFENKTN